MGTREGFQAFFLGVRCNKVPSTDLGPADESLQEGVVGKAEH